MGLIALLASVSGFVVHSHTHRPPGLSLASSACTTGGTFCLSSPTPGPTLYPGAPASSLPLTVTNYSNVPLHVYQVTVAFTNSFPANCDVTAFQVNGTPLPSASPSLTFNLNAPSWITVPAATASGPSTASYPATLALVDNHKGQTSCAGTRLSMSYSARAYYTVPTTTQLADSPNPSTWGQSVTLTATVASAITPTSAGTTPVGTVTFYQCTNSACTTTTPLGSSAVNSTGHASLTSAFKPTGSHRLYAVYAPGCKNASPTCSTSAPDFSGSQSSQITQVVNYTSCITDRSGGNLTVGSGQDICITASGSLAGNVTVNSGGQLDLMGGRVGGNIKVNSGGGLNVAGGSVAGNVTASGATVFNACGAKVSGNVQVSSSSSLVTVGATSSCAGNTVGGGIVVQGETGGYQVIGNTTGGGISVMNNRGTPAVVSGNKVGGGLACSGNSPAPTDSPTPNRVSGKRSGQCASPATF